MYIELFLLDNLLMNLLIMRLAAALLKVSPPLYRQLAAGFASACYAALAAYLIPALASLPARLLPLALITLGLPFKSPRGFLTCMGASLFATLVVGGLACCIALLEGGSPEAGFITGGIGLRTALLIAAASCFLPGAARRILRRNRMNGDAVTLVIVHRGVERRFRAIVDTGNTLKDPLTGLPVAVVSCKAFRSCAVLPVRACTAAGECTLYAFRPDRMEVEGVEVKGLLALSKEENAPAIVPPELVPRI